MVLLEAASCSGAVAMDGVISSCGAMRMEVRMVEGAAARTGAVAMVRPLTFIRLECGQRGGSGAVGGVTRSGTWIGMELKAGGRPTGGRGFGRESGSRSAVGALMIAAKSFSKDRCNAGIAVSRGGMRMGRAEAVVQRLGCGKRGGSGVGGSIGMELKVGQQMVGRGFGGRNGGSSRSGIGALVIAAMSFGRGGRGPSRPRISIPRRPVQEEGSSSSDDSLPHENARDDSNKGGVEVLSGQGGGSKSHPPKINAAQVLQDQFNRFAAAVALADRKMAEDIIREMGDGDSSSASSVDYADEEALDSMEELEVSARILDDSLYQVEDAVPDDRDFSGEIIEELGGPGRVYETNQSVEDFSDLERQLEELYEEVGRMIDEGDEDTARELIEANYEALLDQLDAGVQGVEQAAMLDILAQLYMNMGDYKNAEILLQKISELLDDIRSPQRLLDSVLEHVASMYAGIGKPEEAIPFYVRSLDIQKILYGKDSLLSTKTVLGLAKAYADNDEGSKSIELYQQVLGLMERLKGQENEALVVPLTHLGHTLLEEERAPEAESVLQRAVRVTEKAYGAADGRVGVATCALARSKAAQGQVDEAVHLYRQGLDIMEGCSRFSPDDPVVEVVRTDLAEMLNYLNREDEAQELWEENLRVKETVYGRNDIQLVPHLNNAATSYAHSQRFDKCEPLLRRSLKLMSVHFGPRAPEISVALEMLATALHHLGRGFEAEPLAREAVSIRQSHYGDNHPSTGQAYNCLAAILHGLEKDEEAEKLLWKVLKIQEAELGPDCPEIILTLELLAMLLNEQGRTAELQPIIRRMQRLEAILDESSTAPNEE